MTPAQLEALARLRGAGRQLLGACALLLSQEIWDQEQTERFLNCAVSFSRIITEAAADLTTETVRAQLSASLATGEK